MAFDTLERSREDGRPIALYQFTLGTTVWRYCSGDQSELYNGFVWKALPISDDGVKQSGEATSDALSITAPSSIGPAQTHIGGSPSGVIQVAILHKHFGDNFAAAIYAGEVSQVNFPSPGLARIVCSTLSVSMKRDGLRLAWQRGCPYSLYDSLTCKVDRLAHETTVQITSISGFNVVGAAFASRPDTYFTGGFVEWIHPVRGAEYRGIEWHGGNTVLIFGNVDGLYPGVTLKAYPGCMRTSADCTNKFNNYLNYGGIPHMPGKSPFDGTRIF
jgi:uncharacterized phage protein (TIGR02218 family)